MLSKDYITNLLATNDKAIARALLVLKAVLGIGGMTLTSFFTGIFRK